MEISKQQKQGIKYSENDCALEVFFEFGAINITLKIKSKHYKINYFYEGLPTQLKMYFTSLQELYALFSKSSNFQVDIQKGLILVFVRKVVDNDLIEKKLPIKLNQIVNERIPQKSYDILVSEVEELKNNVAFLMGKRYIKNQFLQQNFFQQDKDDLITQNSLEFQFSKNIKDLNEKIQRTELEIEEIKNSLGKIHEIPLENKGKIQKKRDRQLKEQHYVKDYLGLTETNYLHYFRKRDNMIEYVGEDKKTTQILLQKLLSFQNKYEINCKIIKTHWEYISFGVVDKQTQIDSRYSSITGNAICYLGKYGQIDYGDGEGQYHWKQEGEGFRKNDTITMKVDMKQSKIQWFVNKKLQATIITPLLTDKKRKFVPYVELRNTGDSVEVWQ